MIGVAMAKEGEAIGLRSNRFSPSPVPFPRDREGEQHPNIQDAGCKNKNAVFCVSAPLREIPKTQVGLR